MTCMQPAQQQNAHGCIIQQFPFTSKAETTCLWLFGNPTKRRDTKSARSPKFSVDFQQSRTKFDGEAAALMCHPLQKLALARPKSSWGRVLLLKFVSLSNYFGRPLSLNQSFHFQVSGWRC